MKGDSVFNAICRKSCYQLVIELTKIYLEGINFLLSRNSWILKLWNDVQWIVKLEFESIGKRCQLVSWADQALTKFDSFEVLSGCKNPDKNSSWHNLSFVTRPSEGSWAISLLRRRKLKIYRQNQKEEQISFVLICKVSNKKQIYPRQMAFQNSCIFLLLIFSCFLSVKAAGEGSGNSESASAINLPSFTYKINK